MAMWIRASYPRRIRPSAIKRAIALAAIVDTLLGAARGAGAAPVPTPVRDLGVNSVVVDFGLTTGEGSKYVFGGSLLPNYDHVDAWNKLKTAYGATYARAGIRPYAVVPNTTLETYQANMASNTGPADPATWDFAYVDHWISRAKDAGMIIQPLVLESTSWLTYSGTTMGVPKDWSVFQDIIKKIYRHIKTTYGRDVDTFELLNEPDCECFFTIDGSPYTSKPEAAKDWYYYAASAIREVSASVPIGGIASAEPDYFCDTGIAEAIVKDSRLKDIDGLSFVSVHDYANQGYSVFSNLPAMLQSCIASWGGDAHMPVFVNEWDETLGGANLMSENYVGYVGTALIAGLDYNWKGGAIFSFTPNNVPDDDGPGFLNWAEFGAYSWNGTTATFKPGYKAWSVFAVKMDIAAGNTKNKLTRFDGPTSALGLLNHDGRPVVLASNYTSTALTGMQVKLENLRLSGDVPVEIYVASPTNDGTVPVASQMVPVSNGTLIVPAFDMPAYSAVGIRVGAASGCENDGTWSVVDDDAASYAGSGWKPWPERALHGGNQHYSATADDSFEYTFDGAAVELYWGKGSNRGSADIYIDGQLDRTVSLYDTVWGYQQRFYSTSWPKSGSHTVKLVAKGDGQVGLDFLRYATRTQDACPPSTPGAGPDASAPPNVAGDVGPDGGADGGNAASPDLGGGCDCRTGTREQPSLALLPLGLAVLAGSRWRRAIRARRAGSAMRSRTSSLT